MKTMMKIALAFSLVIGLSFSAHAAGGDAITISGTTVGQNLTFTPSGNTLIVAAATATDYYIGAASDKTTTENGLEYCMVSGYSGYYQKAQATDKSVTAAGTAGTAPTGWTAMGGAEGS